jgi:hypothetical protein
MARRLSFHDFSATSQAQSRRRVGLIRCQAISSLDPVPVKWLFILVTCAQVGEVC